MRDPRHDDDHASYNETRIRNTATYANITRTQEYQDMGEGARGARPHAQVTSDTGVQSNAVSDTDTHAMEYANVGAGARGARPHLQDGTDNTRLTDYADTRGARAFCPRPDTQDTSLTQLGNVNNAPEYSDNGQGALSLHPNTADNDSAKNIGYSSYNTYATVYADTRGSGARGLHLDTQDSSIVQTGYDNNILEYYDNGAGALSHLPDTLDKDSAIKLPAPAPRHGRQGREPGGAYEPSYRGEHNVRDLCCAIYRLVAASGNYNYVDARVPVPSALNMPAWRQKLTNYHDMQVLELLEYGFPMSYQGGSLRTTNTNHASATDFPEHVHDYIRKECEMEAMIGARLHEHFPATIHVSPLMTRPKQNPQKRRIILDLSWPLGESVNTGIPRDRYLDQPYKLQLPTARDLANMIANHGRGCYAFNIDLARAYRQLRADPLDWPRHGISWQGETFIDIAVPFGARWGAAACQRTTNAVCHIAKHNGAAHIVPYIDDFAGVATTYVQAQHKFETLRSTLQQLGLQEAVEKAARPAKQMRWIGLDFDTDLMQIRIPEDKLQSMLHITRAWLHKKKATKAQLQSLLGKYFHVGQCVRPARLFLARMLETLRQAPDTGHATLCNEFRKDLRWFSHYLSTTNGIYIIQPGVHTVEIELDSCLTGCGAICGTQFYAQEYPQSIQAHNHHISRLELLNIVVACRTWAPEYVGARFLVRCDNTAAVFVIRSARGRDPYMLQCARALFLVTARHQVQIDACHKPGAQMQLPDALSRLHLNPGFLEKSHKLIGATRIYPHNDAFVIDDTHI